MTVIYFPIGVVFLLFQWFIMEFTLSIPEVVFTNIPILVLVLTSVIYHFNHMPDFIFITVSTILALKSSCSINILSNY